jgi:hypothetical protein
MNLEYGTLEEHLATAHRAKENNVTYVWSGNLRNPYLAENLRFIQQKDLATVEFVEDYEEQESGYNIKWN